MKSLSLCLVTFAAMGCSSKSLYDITADQVKSHVGPTESGGPVDLAHLPPGAVKHERIFHKGDRMPDGTISPGERRLVTVEVNRSSPLGIKGGGPGKP